MAGDSIARRLKWHELLERHGSEDDAWYAIKASPEWEMTYELNPFGVLDEQRRSLALALMIARGEGSPQRPPAQPPKPRHRPPDPIPEATVKQLKWELAQRKARRRGPEFTQEKIAGRLGLDRTRVQQAEALEQVGWDLLRSHPDFSAKDDSVRWPSAKEAARILASERAEN